MKKKTIGDHSSSTVHLVKHLILKPLTFFCLALITVPSLLFSQTLDDFRTAASSNGVNLIPFSDLRKDATSIADEVQRRKGEAQSYDFDQFSSQKNNLLKEVKKRNDDIESIKKEIDEFKSKHPDGSTSSFEEEINKKNREISDFNDKIRNMNDKMGQAVETYDRLYNARAGLREYFQKALDQLSDVKSNPDKYLGSTPTDEDRNKLKEYVNVIEDQIQSGIKTHQEQEEGAKKRKSDYQNLISTTEYKG